MAHCGYEPTAAHAAVGNPFSALWTAIRGIRTEGPMAPEISLDRQRPAQFVFSRHVDEMLTRLRTEKKTVPAARDATSGKSSEAAGSST
jgi:hypothetical protein